MGSMDFASVGYISPNFDPALNDKFKLDGIVAATKKIRESVLTDSPPSSSLRSSPRQARASPSIPLTPLSDYDGLDHHRGTRIVSYGKRKDSDEVVEVGKRQRKLVDYREAEPAGVPQPDPQLKADHDYFEPNPVSKLDTESLTPSRVTVIFHSDDLEPFRVDEQDLKRTW